MRVLAAACCLGLLSITPAALSQIAQLDGTVPNTRAQIQSLTRNDDDTLTLTVRLINEGAKPLKPCADFGRLGCDFVANIYLADLPHRLKYPVGKDISGKCACSHMGENDIVAAKSSKTLWAKFRAPPQTVERVTVVLPGFETAEVSRIIAIVGSIGRAGGTSMRDDEVTILC